jgi:hypothetical protein
LLHCCGGKFFDCEVDGRGGFAQMERDGGGVADAEEGGGKQVLSGVLLDVVEAAFLMDASADPSAWEQRFFCVVPDFAVLVFFDADDLGGEFRAAARGGNQLAGVVRLAAAGGVESGAIERHTPQRLATGAGELLYFCYGGVEIREEGICVIQAGRHFGRFCY